MYYAADDRLRVADGQSCLYFAASTTTYACDPARSPAYERRSAFEEYRYDALGRRVLVRTRSEFACTQYCLNILRRTVWDGDQVLYEISAPGGSSATAPQMEADTGLAVPFFLNQQHTAVAGFFPYGRVMYEHGGGIDAPLGVVRMEYSSELNDPQVIVPLSDWRGTYDRGTTIVGSCVLYSSNGTMLAPPPDSTPSSGDQYGGVVGGGTYNGTKEHCVDVDWPGAYTWSARQYRRGYSGPDSWMGSLIFESRDASGLYFRRNRYYDSEKGRFTQEDPIGLAGGLNAYGFANGDPVMYSDPAGLCPSPPWDCPQVAEELKARLIAKAVAVAAVLGELSGIAPAIRFASGRDATGRQLTAPERALDGAMAALSVVPGEGDEAGALRWWSKSTFESEAASAAYHLAEHGRAGQSLVEYTADARRFFQRNRAKARVHILQGGEGGLKIVSETGEGGIFTRGGKIVSYWYQ